jgi:hypothetical protein
MILRRLYLVHAWRVTRSHIARHQVALPAVMFWATASVVRVAGPTTAAATEIPNTEITAAAIKNSYTNCHQGVVFS